MGTGAGNRGRTYPGVVYLVGVTEYLVYSLGLELRRVGKNVNASLSRDWG